MRLQKLFFGSQKYLPNIDFFSCNILRWALEVNLNCQVENHWPYRVVWRLELFWSGWLTHQKETRDHSQHVQPPTAHQLIHIWWWLVAWYHRLQRCLVDIEHLTGGKGLISNHQLIIACFNHGSRHVPLPHTYSILKNVNYQMFEDTLHRSVLFPAPATMPESFTEQIATVVSAKIDNIACWKAVPDADPKATASDSFMKPLRLKEITVS